MITSDRKNPGKRLSRLHVLCTAACPNLTSTRTTLACLIACVFFLILSDYRRRVVDSPVLPVLPALLPALLPCTEPHDGPDGGDCQAFGGDRRRPSWACMSAMRAELPRFVRVYEQRPVRKNAGGMRFDHAFALWFVLRATQPATVIESGAFNGQGTWLMRQALPRARIISLDPRAPPRRLSGVEYLVGRNFRDFAAIDWKERRVDPEHTLVFLDDHQSGFRRVLLDNLKLKFRRFIAEDNYPFQIGDNMSLKEVCEVERKALWKGVVQDNFGKNITRQTWDEHIELGKRLNEALSIYYEFPPTAASELTGQKRYDPRRASTPIVTDAAQFRALFSQIDKKEFGMYTHFTYVEVRKDFFNEKPRTRMSM